MPVLIAGLVLFLGTHFARVAAPGMRANFIAAKGSGPWQGIYSVISILGFVLLIYGYSLARENADEAFAVSSLARTVQLLAMPVALILVVAAQFPAGYIKKTLRHPMILGVLIWSGTHLWGNGDWASITLFGAFFVWALLTTISSFRRPSEPVEAKVLFDGVAIVAGLVLTWLFLRFLHEWLFGVGIV
ncbi:MAG: NnrU family protein [Pseudomonadota bacterium]